MISALVFEPRAKSHHHTPTLAIDIQVEKMETTILFGRKGRCESFVLQDGE